MIVSYSIPMKKGMPGKKGANDEPLAAIPLPELAGRVAVLGGMASEKTLLLVGVALRHVRQQGAVMCLDARRQRQTEVQFRLLFRGQTAYVALPPSGEVPEQVTQYALGMISRSLTRDCGKPPLLLLDNVRETPAWERTLAFFLKAGSVVVELLPSPNALVFGRYDTVLLLRADPTMADALSRAVGRKVSAEDLTNLKPDEGILMQLTRVQRVVLPQECRVRSAE
jgi:hypothetical protein